MPNKDLTAINHARGHQALDGKTPAEACGIKVEGRDKWLTLIQNAVHAKERRTSGRWAKVSLEKCKHITE